MSNPNDPFTEAQREGLYRAIFERRDVRSQFLSDAIPEEVLARILRAAHHAPSVGFMQPWDFIVIDSLAVQNLWLAARGEGIGVGWVSILDQDVLSNILQLPDHVYPLAYLCLGYVSEFLEQPELQSKGWRSRLPLEDLVHGNTWGGALDQESLLARLKQV